MNYTSLKKRALKWLPASWLFRLEPFLRKIISIWYRGTTVCCPVCNHAHRKFISLDPGRNLILCPRCGSLPRQRLLWLYLHRELNIADRNWQVLHFSPNRMFQRYMHRKKNLAYITSDLESSFTDIRTDITNIPFPDNHFDLVICYHVLEHVGDDKKAMSEVFRILKKNGTALFQVPFRNGDTVEDPEVEDPEDRKKLFGQEDHVRWYGLEDFVERLGKAGFEVSSQQYAKQLEETMDIKHYGLNRSEKFVYGIKKP